MPSESFKVPNGVRGESIKHSFEARLVRVTLPDQKVHILGECVWVARIQMLRRVHVEEVAKVVIHVDGCKDKIKEKLISKILQSMISIMLVLFLYFFSMNLRY